jgi:hypothetical protein
VKRKDNHPSPKLIHVISIIGGFGVVMYGVSRMFEYAAGLEKRNNGKE